MSTDQEVKIRLKNSKLVNSILEDEKSIDILTSPGPKSLKFYKNRDEIVEALADPESDLLERANNQKELLFLLKDEPKRMRMGLKAITSGQYEAIQGQLEQLENEQDIQWVIDLFSEAPYHLDENGERFPSSTQAIDRALGTQDRDYVGFLEDYLNWSVELYGGEAYPEDVITYLDRMEEREEEGVIVNDAVSFNYSMPSLLNKIKEKRPNCTILTRFLQQQQREKRYITRLTWLEWDEAIEDLKPVRKKFEETITGPDYEFTECEEFFRLEKGKGCSFVWYRLQ